MLRYALDIADGAIQKDIGLTASPKHTARCLPSALPVACDKISRAAAVFVARVKIRAGANKDTGNLFGSREMECRCIIGAAGTD